LFDLAFIILILPHLQCLWPRCLTSGHSGNKHRYRSQKRYFRSPRCLSRSVKPRSDHPPARRYFKIHKAAEAKASSLRQLLGEQPKCMAARPRLRSTRMPSRPGNFTPSLCNFSVLSTDSRNSENSKANRIKTMKGPAESGQICSVG
jgi:hypothetical protein